MARTRTLTNLLSDVRVEGDYNRSAVFTDTILTRWINQAIARVYNLLTAADPELYAKEASLTTTASQDYVNLPADFLKLLRLDILTSTSTYARLFRYALAEENNYQDLIGNATTESRYRYNVQGSKIKLKPTPGVVDTLRIVYVPCVTDLSLGSDTFDGLNGYEDLVVQYVLLRCDLREEKAIGERLQVIQQLEAAIRAAADARDEAEPFLLPDNTSWSWGG